MNTENSTTSMSLNKLVIKYATRGRPEMFMAAIRNIQGTIGNINHSIIVSADNDDESMNCERIKTFCDSVNNLVIYFGDHDSKVNAINDDLDDVEFDWLINMSDDMVFIVEKWGEKMKAEIESVFPDTDFFAHFNDGYVFDKLPTMSIMGREYYERDKCVYHPSYKSVSCDAEAMYVAMMRNAHHYFPTQYFSHIHPSNIGTPEDQTYKRNNQFTDADTNNYFIRLMDYFGITDQIERSRLPIDPNDYRSRIIS